MSLTVKRITGDYEIQTVNLAGSTENQIIFTTDQVLIRGDLQVTGDYNTTTVTESNLSLKDRFILLNEGETGSGVSAGTYSGIEVDRGSLDKSVFYFNETTDKWVIGTVNTSTGTVTEIGDVLTTGAGGGLTDVVDDITPQLGGDLDVNSQSIVSVSNGDIVLAPDGTGTVKIESTELAFDKLASDPTAQADYNLLYHKTEGSGGTGLYFKTSSTADELVSKAKAIVYGIIF